MYKYVLLHICVLSDPSTLNKIPYNQSYVTLGWQTDHQYGGQSPYSNIAHDNMVVQEQSGRKTSTLFSPV